LKAIVAVFTFNRAETLDETLAKLVLVRIPEGLNTAFLVVDNNSTDSTGEVIEKYAKSTLRTRHVVEPKRGVAHSRNRALTYANGADVVVFLDDDARPTPMWLGHLCAPILMGKAHAAVGRIVLPTHLVRSWMTPRHRALLGSTELLTPEAPQALIGANMAFAPSILKRVPAFDTELGPGRLGFWEDSLFSLQLRKAGYKIAAALDAVVEHHFDQSRLLRESFMDRARKEGRCRAYVAHHWEHRELASPRRKAGVLTLRLLKTRITRRRERAHREGISEWELTMMERLYYYRQYLIERTRPRVYSRYGLVKHEF
jgi:glycosyltransferase involved in cell wall biosynthesis